jgi:dihydrofolate reductase
MGRVIWSVMSSLDGFSAAPGEGFETIDWFRADEEWLDYSVELLDQADTLLFGGVTFAGMEQYWPYAEGPVAERMNALPKVGFSHTERSTVWPNARVDTDPVATVGELRRGEGLAVLMGSATLAGTLSEHVLVDEYRFAVNPVLLGGGVPVAPPGSGRVELDREDTRIFGSGIVELRCTPRTTSG